MRRFFSEHTAIRGFLIIGLIALVVVVLSLQPVLATVGGTPEDRVLPRDRLLPLPHVARAAERHRGLERPEPERLLCGDPPRCRRHRRLIGLGASGPDALAFFLVLAACAYAVFRIWRDEHTYS
jgi:hypothetical protein